MMLGLGLIGGGLWLLFLAANTALERAGEVWRTFRRARRRARRSFRRADHDATPHGPGWATEPGGPIKVNETTGEVIVPREVAAILRRPPVIPLKAPPFRLEDGRAPFAVPGETFTIHVPNVPPGSLPRGYLGVVDRRGTVSRARRRRRHK